MRALAATATDAGTLFRLPSTPVPALEEGWDRVKHGTDFLVRLLGENAGIKTSNLIPSMNALVPLVVLLGQHDRNVEFTESDALIYWLLSVFVTGRFSSAADTKIAQDALSARRPDPVRQMYRNAGLMGYLAAKKRRAKDWWHGVEISETSGGGGFAIEYHHVHPQATLRASYAKGEVNDLANLAFISAAANKRISDRPPVAYFPELLDGRDELGPHLVPTDESLRSADRYRDFLVARRRLLAGAMTELLDERRPEWVVEADVEASEAQPARAVSLALTDGPELSSYSMLAETARAGQRLLPSQISSACCRSSRTASPQACALARTSQKSSRRMKRS